MSLAQHVTSIEGVDREEPIQDDETIGPAKPIRRKLSYDAFAAEITIPAFLQPVLQPVLPLEPPPHAAPYKVSTAKRIAQVAFAIVACCFASGIVFGYASLKPVLVAEGVYRELCQFESDEDDSGPWDEVPCTEQDMRLNLFFVAASITTNVSSLFAGAILDRFGRRPCYTAASVFLAIGCIIEGFAFRIPEFDGYLLGNILIALGGTFLFVPSFQMANAFPKYSGIIVAMVTGAFDASAAVFLFYRMVWDATGLSPSHFFFGFLAVPVLLLVGEWTLMPPHDYLTIPELEQKIEKVQDPALDVHDSDDELEDTRTLTRVRSARAEERQQTLDQIEEVVGTSEERDERVLLEEKRHAASGIWGVLHGLPAHRQMLTPWFILILLLTVLQMLRMNYFIATVRAQYRYLLQSEAAAETINDFFDVALPMGGVFATPFIGVLLDNMSVAAVMGTLAGFITVIGVLNCLPFLWAGYATVISFVLFRPLYYSAMSDYATKVFGFATFGRVYGAITCFSGLVNFAQTGLDALIHGPLHGDPTPINITMAVLGTGVAIFLTAFIMIQARIYQQSLEEAPAASAAPSAQASVRRERLPLIREMTSEYGTI